MSLPTREEPVRGRPYLVGADVARLLAMAMIVMLHMLDGPGGGTLKTATGSSLATGWGLYLLAYPAVDVYGLLSGYLGYRETMRPPHMARWCMLWLEAVIANLGSYAVVRALGLPYWQGVDVKMLVLPVAYGSYWYLSCYLGVLLVAPIVNAGVTAMPRKHVRPAFVLGFLLVTLLSTVDDVVDPLGMKQGFSFAWLAFLYLLGALLRRGSLGERTPAGGLWAAYGLCALLTWGFWMAFHGSGATLHQVQLEYLLKNYCSPTVLAMAVVILLLCLRIGPPRRASTERAMRRCGSATWGVFVLDNTQVAWAWRRGRFEWLGRLAPLPLAASTLGWALGEFAVVLAVSMLVEAVLDRTGVARGLDALELRLRARVGLA